MATVISLPSYHLPLYCDVDIAENMLSACVIINNTVCVHVCVVSLFQGHKTSRYSRQARVSRT